MKSFQDFLENMGWREADCSSCADCTRYCKAGRIFLMQNENMDGLYWYYETDQFIINIHDFMIKKDMMIESFPDVGSFMSFSSSYIKSANGECFSPYQNLTSNSVFVTTIEKYSDFRFLLHANFPFISVGINFKDKIIKEYLPRYFSDGKAAISNMLLETSELVAKPLEKLASMIMNCRMSSPAAEIFLEAKAMEWLSVTLNAYLNKSTARQLPEPDEKAIENVASYLNDHFAMDTPQELLEGIAMMSGTKLKNVFKEKYRMSITEYLQRKRMNMAETLLSTTKLEIRDVAKSVGYTSHSRFTALFRKYKGIYPHAVRKMGSASQTSLMKPALMAKPASAGCQSTCGESCRSCLFPKERNQ